MDLNNLSQKQKIALAIAGLIAAVVMYYFKPWQASLPNTEDGFTLNSGADSEAEDKTGKSKSMYFEITGQVRNPGVYELKEKVMIIELISFAGGLTDQADLQELHKNITLSSVVEPNQKVYIPGYFEKSKSSSAGTASSSAVASGKVSINNASSTELESLPEIGPATAQKIIAARPYSKVEDLKKVEGIGEKTYNTIAPLVVL